tara:strand:+ start:354 stop:644 length:291 start_codon:yes stop_codon:yes gene_type:complete
MVNKKKSKVKKEKHLPIVRTREERTQEVKKIITTLSELQLSVEYEPIRQLYNIMNEYISCGERVIVNIPFPEIKKRIEGILSVNVKEEVWLRMNSI